MNKWNISTVYISNDSDKIELRYFYEKKKENNFDKFDFYAEHIFAVWLCS